MSEEKYYQDTDFPNRKPLKLKVNTAAKLNNSEGKQRYVPYESDVKEIIISKKKDAAEVSSFIIKAGGKGDIVDTGILNDSVKRLKKSVDKKIISEIENQAKIESQDKAKKAVSEVEKWNALLEKAEKIVPESKIVASYGTGIQVNKDGNEAKLTAKENKAKKPKVKRSKKKKDEDVD